jgi:chromosomal replication initiator protein
MPTNGNGGPRALNQDFTFDRFVVGRCNEFAYAASKALAIEGQFPCSSLFIVAKTGLGKSHLSQATAHALLESNPRIKVIYITAEDFVNEMIFALKNHRIDEFKTKYRRSCDVLLLEEIQFLSGKEKTQLELGYTLDALANDHKRIIFTSSLLPKDIPNLTKELASRLTSGIITTLDTPDYETRVKIIERKSSEQGLVLPHEIFHLLAKDLTGDIRQMESALRCLKAKADLMKATIDPDLAKEVLLCHVPTQKLLTLDDVKAMVCQYFKVDPALLASKSRKKIHAYPRNVYVYLCRQHTDRTVEEIGRSLSRNHSTILYASEVIEHKMKVDKRVKNQIEFLSNKLKDMKK